MIEKVAIGLALGSAILFSGPAEDATQIMRRAINRTEANWHAAPNYSFLRIKSKSKRGAQSVTVTQQVLMIDGSQYSKTIAEAGHPLTPAAARQEEEKLRKEVSRRSKESPRERAQRLRKYAEDRERDHLLLTQLSEAFDYTFAANQQQVRTEAWVIEGHPKSGYIAPSRDAKLLSSMNIKVWVDKATYQWMRLEAEVTQPVALYGSLAKVSPGTRFTLEQEPVSQTVWLPNRFTMQVNASALGLLHEDFTEDEMYSNYLLANPLNETLAGEAPPKSVTLR
jgi:hypothetical protein